MLCRILYFAALLAPFSMANGAEADPKLAGYRYPKGIDVQIAAAEPLVVNPVTMTFGPDGRLYVIEWKEGRGPNDHIKVLTDDNGDGRFDRADIFMDNLELPAGLLFWDGWVYITLDHDVVRFADRDHDGKYEVREVIASGFGNDDSHHRVSGISFGPDGYLYLTTGDSDAHARGSDGSKADVLRCGGVFRCKPDGSAMENVAFGMRNPWGNVAFDDTFQMFHTDNDNEGSPGFTGCRLLHVVEGGDYGWRLREGARCCAPDFERATWNGGRPGRLGWMAETGRGAPAGLCVLNSAAFPDSYRNLIVYPDVFRKSVRAYHLKPDGATYKAVDEFEFLASDEGLFRPTDTEIGPDGALYILDWRTDSGGAGQLSGNGKTGRIYRMTWSGTAEEPARKTFAPDRFLKLASSGVDELIKDLRDPDYGMRRAASLELIRRGNDETNLHVLRTMVSRLADAPSARLHAMGALFALRPDDAENRGLYKQAFSDPDPSVRRYALELHARRPLSDEKANLSDAMTLLRILKSNDPSPQIRRASAMALGRFGKTPMFDGKPFASPIAAALVLSAAVAMNSDSFLRDAFTRGLERLGQDSIPVLVKAVSDPDPKLSQAALFTLQGWRNDDALAALVSTATSRDASVTDDARVGLFRTLREMVPRVPADPIAAWLVEKQGSSKSRAQAILLLASMHQNATLAVSPILAGLIEDKNDEVRKAALVVAREIRSDKARAVLLALVKSEDRPGEERGQALSALQGYDGVELAPLIRAVYPKATDSGLRIELLRALAAQDFAAAAELADGELNSTNRDVRHVAIALLGSKPESAQAVAKKFLDGKLPPEDLSRVIDAVRPHETTELKATLHALLGKTLLAAPEVHRLRDFVNRLGNPERGRAIYLDAKKGACASCHRMEGAGGNVGPDLTRVWDTLSFDKRVESILEPSKEIKEGFGTFKVATVDGRILSGLLLADTVEGVTLKDAEGREVRIAAREVEQKGSDRTSLMPAGVVGHLSFNELADLLAFLGDRKAQEELRSSGK